MAGHGDLGASEKKGIDDVPTLNAENLQSNMKTIHYSRTFLSIIAGVIAGIMGFTGLTGFIFYFLVMAITSVGLIAKSKFSVHSCFDSWNRIILDGFLGGLMSFVLFWTWSTCGWGYTYQVCSGCHYVPKGCVSGMSWSFKKCGRIRSICYMATWRERSSAAAGVTMS